jgi:hypothetical protein
MALLEICADPRFEVSLFVLTRWLMIMVCTGRHSNLSTILQPAERAFPDEPFAVKLAVASFALRSKAEMRSLVHFKA